MSNSNTFTNNLAETPIDSAYKFSTFSDYINSGKLTAKFSPKCIFCSSTNTVNLMADGSMKNCMNCRKMFKPFILS